MIMKFLSALLMIFCLAVMPGWAQDPSAGDEHQPPSADQIVAQMQAKLNLTQNQVTAITPIIEKYSSQREELRQRAEDGTADRDSMHAQMKQLTEDEKQELSQVLSADQMGQWEQMMSHARHKYSSEGSENNGGGPSGSTGGGNGGG